MIPRFFGALLALVLFMGSLPNAANAQADSGQIILTVSDGSAAHTPVTLARVLLDGPVMTSEYSGENGAVKFTDVPDGIYRARVFKSGYQSVTSEQFEVSNGRAVNVTVVLAKVEQLKEIGSITVKSSATITTSSVGDSSAQRKLSGTLADALGKISGVAVNTSSADGDATQTVSLQGQDASQTALSLDGIPLNAPGMAGDLRAIGTDLFRGSSVSFGPQSGGLAGGVNFRTLEPTLAWQGTSTFSAGSYGKYNWSLGETGSLGPLGIAFQHSSRTTPSLANGMRFTDTSGLNYEHDAQSQNVSDLLKLRTRIGKSQTLTGTYLSSNTSSDLICLQITGALPCGYGPNNSNASHFTMYSLSDSALIGQTAVQGALFSTSVKADRDLLNRFLNGIPDPTGSLTDTTTKGFSLSAILPAKERHTISISANSMSSTSQTSPLIASASPYANGSRTTNYSSITLNDAIQSSTKLKLNERIGLSQASNSPASLLAALSANWTPAASDTYSASFSLGGVAAHAGPLGNLSDPHSLRFDCNGNVAYGNAPGDVPGASSSTDMRVTWQHKLKNGVVNTSLYRQVQSGVLLNTQVNGTVLAGVLPAGYLSAVQTLYDSPGGCNAGAGAPFGAQNVYFGVPIGGVKRVYQGLQLAANLAFGNVNVQPYYDITQAQAISGDPRISNSYSFITSGGQLPNTPLHKAGLTVDYKAPRSSVEWLATAQYVGSNNSQNLPAYTMVDAGVDVHLAHGDLTIAGNNLFNAYGGIFTTNAGAVPYTTQGGGKVATIARPNAPRQFSFTYTIPFGASARSAPSVTLASRIGGDGEGGPAGRGGPGGRLFNLTPLPAAPPADPLAVTASATCTADAQKNIAPFLGQLKAYLAKIEMSKSANGYPDKVAGAPELPGASVVYHKTGTSYALTLGVQRVSAMSSPAAAALPACLAIHVAQPEDVQSRGLYAPPPALFARPALQFMPAVGFYIPRQQPQAGQQSFRLYKLPTTPPATPFMTRANDTCTAQVLPQATKLLAELEAYFKDGKALQNWKVTAHTAAGGTWFELANDDIATIPMLLNCGHISAGSSEEIKATGFDGVRPPSLNYTPKLGLYIVRGGPRPPGATPAGIPPAGAPPPGAPPPGAPPPHEGGMPPA
ncbi:MAG: hypothetical protein NVSMB31_00490 [Vulcanimicrobiaceae bacterium]